MIRISFTIFILFQFATSFSNADWIPEKDAIYQIIYSKAEIEIDKTGLSTSTTSYEMKALNEAGRSHLVMQKVPFNPDSSKLEVIKASSITDNVEVAVDLSTIKIRPTHADNGGVSNTQDVIIPFTNIKVGSRIKYTIKEKSTRVLVPGLFSMKFVFGVNAPELSGDAKIRSALPLYIAKSDPWSILDTKEYREGDSYIFEMHQRKPIYKFPSEFNPILKRSQITLIEISTMNQWSNYIQPVAEKYEKILSKKDLPSSFVKIADLASKEKSIEDKIDRVTSELAAIMTYSGDWTTFDKMYFPKELEEIGKNKTGDCKDFAISTTAILRKIGIDASVAMTMRKSPTKYGYITLESLDLTKPTGFLFNHAIVKVKTKEKVIWIDPTNIISNSRYVFMDIAGSNALEISSLNSTLEKIPYPDAHLNFAKFEKNINLRDDNTVESETIFELGGEYAKSPLEASHSQNEEAGQKALMSILRTDEKTAKVFYENTNLKTRIAGTLKGKQKAFGERMTIEKDGKKYLFAALPNSLNFFFSMGNERKTDFDGLATLNEKSVIRIYGFDFVGLQAGCTIHTPWFNLQRKFIKTKEGFEILDLFDTKKIEISAVDINTDKFKFAVDDIQDCAQTQGVEIQKLEVNKKLSDRLATYTFEKAKGEFDQPGPMSISGARNALHIVENRLTLEPNSKKDLILKARSIRQVGYKNNVVDRTEYFDMADSILINLLATYPKDFEILRQLTYGSMFKKDFAKMYQYFQEYYLVSPKDFELYYLGGSMAVETKNNGAAISALSKALELATTKLDRAKTYKSLADLYWNSKDPNNAIIYYKKSVLEVPENTWNSNNLMALLSEYKRWDEAIEIGEALLKKSSFGMAKRNLADSYAGKAQELNNKARAIDPTFKNAESKKLYLLSESLSMRGLSHHENNVNCLMNIGNLHLLNAVNNQDSYSARKAITYLERVKKIENAPNASIENALSSLQRIAAGLHPLPSTSSRYPASK